MIICFGHTPFPWFPLHKWSYWIFPYTLITVPLEVQYPIPKNIIIVFSNFSTCKTKRFILRPQDLTKTGTSSISKELQRSKDFGRKDLQHRRWHVLLYAFCCDDRPKFCVRTWYDEVSLQPAFRYVSDVWNVKRVALALGDLSIACTCKHIYIFNIPFFVLFCWIRYMPKRGKPAARQKDFWKCRQWRMYRKEMNFVHQWLCRILRNMLCSSLFSFLFTRDDACWKSMISILSIFRES